MGYQGKMYSISMQTQNMLNTAEKMIRMQFESDGNKIMIFKRPLFSNTDWSIGNMMEKSSDLIYHPWYYTIFRKHT